MKLQNQRGASLIEVMIAVGMFLIGMEALLAVATQSIAHAKRAEYVYTASSLAKNHIERLRAYSFSALASAAETDTVIDADGDADPAGQFERTTTVTTNYTGDPDLTQLTVSVKFSMQGVLSAQAMSASCVMFNEG